MRERLLKLVERWRKQADDATLPTSTIVPDIIRAMADELAAELSAALDDSAGVGAYRDALQKIADGEVESRYARDDLARALYQIEAVREFAKGALAAVRGE